MSTLQQDFKVEVEGRGGSTKEIDIKIIADGALLLRHEFRNQLEPIDGYDISCKTGIECNWGIRRVTVKSLGDKPKTLTAQFKSWEAEHGVPIAKSPEDTKIIEAVATKLIEKLEYS